MSHGTLCNLLRASLVTALLLFLLMHSIPAYAMPCCSDCPQDVQIGGPECPQGSACYGCWTHCEWDGGDCPCINPNCWPATCKFCCGGLCY